ncbi:MAG TPA: F0F1 ATP synthase subunit A [Anaerolineaceae bacterium]
MTETKRKWRWGVNRWWILGFTLLTVVAVNLIAPVRPHIQVAPENVLHEPLFTLPVIGEFYLTNTLIMLLVVDLIILVIALIIRNTTRKGSLVPSGLAGAMETLLEVIYNLTESSAGKHARKIFPWFATISLLVLVGNMSKLLPGVESIGFIEKTSKEGHEAIELIPGILSTITTGEAHGEGYMLVPFFRGIPTDLNFTVALALISVFMTQVIGVQSQGFRYFSKFFNTLTLFKKPFFGFMDLIVSILELISEFAKILSFAFRLFGNMFAGAVLLFLVSSMVPIFFPSLIYMFEFFIGLIQAFVFGMLTMVFMAQATRGHGGEEHHEESHA